MTVKNPLSCLRSQISTYTVVTKHGPWRHLEVSITYKNEKLLHCYFGGGVSEKPLFFCFTFQRQYLMCVFFISQNIPTNKLDCGKKSGHLYVCMHSFKQKDKEICGVSCFTEVPLHWTVIPEDRHLAVETLKAINRPSVPVHTESLNWRPFNSNVIFFWKMCYCIASCTSHNRQYLRTEIQYCIYMYEQYLNVVMLLNVQFFGLFLYTVFKWSYLVDFCQPFCGCKWRTSVHLLGNKSENVLQNSSYEKSCTTRFSQEGAAECFWCAFDVLLKAEGADKSTYVKLMKLIKSFFSREIVCVSVCVCARNPPVCTPVLSQAQILAVFKNNTGNG